MIMFAICSPVTPDSGFSSPSCSYWSESPKRRPVSRKRIAFTQEACTQTEPCVAPELKRIAKRLALLCADFDKEFFSEESLKRREEEERKTDGLWSWIPSSFW